MTATATPLLLWEERDAHTSKPNWAFSSFNVYLPTLVNFIQTATLLGRRSSIMVPHFM